MKKKMLFFVNPNAGHAEIRANLMEVLQIFTLGGYDVTVHPTSHAREITEVIASVGERYDMIVSTGGDGTLNETVSGLMQLAHPPVLGYVPGGTVNDVASTLKLPKNTLDAAKVVVTGREFLLDIGSFNENWFTYVAAFGAFTDVAYQTPQEDKRVFGRMAYLLAGARAIGDIRPVHVRAIAPDRMIEDDVLIGMVCSTTSVGGFKAWRDLEISLNDGLSEVVLVKDIKNLIDFNAVAGAILRQDFDNDYFDFFQTDSIRFEFNAPVAWTLDGEFGGSVETAEISNHSRALRIMVPQDETVPGIISGR